MPDNNELLAKKIHYYMHFRELFLFEEKWRKLQVKQIKEYLDDTEVEYFQSLIIDRNRNRIIEDIDHPKIHGSWLGNNVSGIPAYKYYDNLLNGIIYHKGKRDSKTVKPVFPVLKKGDDVVIFPAHYEVADLPNGIHYVDCE